MEKKRNLLISLMALAGVISMITYFFNITEPIEVVSKENYNNEEILKDGSVGDKNTNKIGIRKGSTLKQTISFEKEGYFMVRVVKDHRPVKVIISSKTIKESNKEFSFYWDGLNEVGEFVKTGTYDILITSNHTDGTSHTKKFTYLIE